MAALLRGDATRDGGMLCVVSLPPWPRRFDPGLPAAAPAPGVAGADSTAGAVMACVPGAAEGGELGLDSDGNSSARCDTRKFDGVKSTACPCADVCWKLCRTRSLVSEAYLVSSGLRWPVAMAAANARCAILPSNLRTEQGAGRHEGTEADNNRRAPCL